MCDLLGIGNVHCTNVDAVFRLMQVGFAARHSEPAHTLFTVTLEQQWVSKEGLLQHRLSTASFSTCAAQSGVANHHLVVLGTKACTCWSRWCTPLLIQTECML